MWRKLLSFFLKIICFINKINDKFRKKCLKKYIFIKINKKYYFFEKNMIFNQN